MRARTAILGVALALCAAAPALADNYPVKDATGTTQTMASKLVSGVHHTLHVIEGLINGTGAPQPVNVDSVGNVGVNVQPATGLAATASTTAEACHVFKASGGKAISLSGYAGGAVWIEVFDANVAPADGSVTPSYWAYVSQAGSWSMSFGATPGLFSNGITACASSTGPLTKTAFSTNTVFSGRVL